MILDSKLVDYYFSTTSFYPKKYRIAQNSWKLVDWIAKRSILKGNAKLVSMQIASYYSPKVGYSFPSYEDIINSAGVSYGTVARAIRDMKLSGEWIVISARSAPRSRHTNNRYYYLGPVNSDNGIEFGGEEIIYKKNRIDEITDDEIDEKRTYAKPPIPAKKFNTIIEYEDFLKTFGNEWFKWKP